MDTFMVEKPYNEMEDEELVNLAKLGDEQAIDLLYKRYEPIVRNKTRNSLSGFIDREDLFQEGMIAVFDAIDSFDLNRGSSFKTYALTLVENRVINVLRTLKLKRCIPQKLIISLSQNMADEELSPFQDFLRDEKNPSPEWSYIDEESTRIILDIAKKSLSDLEYKVFCLFTDNRTYKEISKDLDIDKKAVDNAIQRIRIKLLREII